MKIEIDTNARFIRVTPHGLVTLERVVHTIDEMLDHSEFESGMPSLWDFRACEIAGFSTDELRQLGAVARGNAERRGRARLAIVVSTDLQFGLSRMFAMLNELSHLEAVVFRDIVEAERWILDPD